MQNQRGLHSTQDKLRDLLDRLGLREEGAVSEDEAFTHQSSFEASPERELAFHYGFIEMFAGSAKVSREAENIGLVVGPPVDIEFSGEMDMKQTRVLAWLSHMIVSGHLGSIMVEPVCTTFSIMRRPPLRSKVAPYGFNSCCEKTITANILTILWIAWRYYVPALGEQPWM